MATATEISTRALRRVGAFDVLEAPSAVDVASATEALTAMIASWEGEGLSGDILPIDTRFEQAVIAMLAMRLCEEYGKTPGPVLVRDADRGWSTLQAAYFAVPESKFENALRFTGQATNYGYITGNTVVTYDAWQPETAYVLRAFVINNANRYELVTAGTSASSGGPTGTDSEITDGTCVWCWRGVTAA